MNVFKKFWRFYIMMNHQAIQACIVFMEIICLSEIELCAVTGCTDSQACNYDAIAIYDDENCTYAEDYYDCNNNWLSDVDEDKNIVEIDGKHIYQVIKMTPSDDDDNELSDEDEEEAD